MWAGFEYRWDDPAAYLNADAAGQFHYPGFAPDAVRWLVEHRSVGALGIDTIGIDPGTEATFRFHSATCPSWRQYCAGPVGTAGWPWPGETATSAAGLCA